MLVIGGKNFFVAMSSTSKFPSTCELDQAFDRTGSHTANIQIVVNGDFGPISILGAREIDG